jgi:FlaA1/EpsC-like NDP-sugar epimerase
MNNTMDNTSSHLRTHSPSVSSPTLATSHPRNFTPSVSSLFHGVYAGKRVLVTGHTGFKGSWLCVWLKEMGANVVGYALEPYTDRDNFVVTKLKDKITHRIGDVRDFHGLKKVYEEYWRDSKCA